VRTSYCFGRDRRFHENLRTNETRDGAVSHPRANGRYVFFISYALTAAAAAAAVRSARAAYYRTRRPHHLCRPNIDFPSRSYYGCPYANGTRRSGVAEGVSFMFPDGEIRALVVVGGTHRKVHNIRTRLHTINLPRYYFHFGVTDVSVTPSGNILRTGSAAAAVQSKRPRGRTSSSASKRCVFIRHRNAV